MLVTRCQLWASYVQILQQNGDHAGVMKKWNETRANVV